MKRLVVLGIFAILPLSTAAYAHDLGPGTGGTAARAPGPSGATGGGHHEPMGFSLLATRNCWADASVGCNASPNPPAEAPPAAAAPAPAAAPKS